MKANHVLLLPELIEISGVQKDTLSQWVDQGLLTPLGRSEEGTTIFSSTEAERAIHIRDLHKIGYSLEEIRRIIRKVGIPGNPNPDHPGGKVSPPLTIGILAERVGVSPRTIKHWEEKGIIEPDMRSSGGFRLYSEAYVYLCQLVRDLQLFGYSLDEIKKISDLFRTFLGLQQALENFPQEEAQMQLAWMQEEVAGLNERMKLLKAGIRRWENLLGKKIKEIVTIDRRNRKRSRPPEQADQ